MKKSRSMRLASALLVLTLLSTCMISGTFAKYTTQDSGSDVARVAKWGVELQVVGNLYGDTYKNTIVKEDSAGFTVQSSDAVEGKRVDVVAPGTENNEGFTFSLKGQPEVAGKVTTTMKIQNVFLKEGTYGVMIPVDANVVTADNFDEFTDEFYYYNNVKESYIKAVKAKPSDTLYTLEDIVEVEDDYYPVVYKLAGNTNTEYDIGTDAENTLSEVAKKIATVLYLKEDQNATEAAANTSVIYTGTREFAVNEDLSKWYIDGLKLTWSWAFGDEDKVGDSASENDKADTILGLLNHGDKNNTPDGAVVKFNGENYVEPTEYEDYCLDTQFSIDITVTQVD